MGPRFSLIRNCCHTFYCVCKVNAEKKSFKGKETKKMSAATANEIANQLYVFHDPFSGKTTQPKIPDGKTTHSLGFTTECVEEIACAATNPDNTIHMILFPGMANCLLSFGATNKSAAYAGGQARNFYLPSFSVSNGLDWTAITSSAGGDVGQIDNYSYWRNVSVGLKLKLLNSVEEDDGWWEAIRLRPELKGDQWWLTTAGNDSFKTQNGIVAPIGLANDIQNVELANDPSFATGLLRDLHRVQFELHGITDHHDLQQMQNAYEMSAGDIGTVEDYATGRNIGILSANGDGAMDVLKAFNDMSYDMVYIRLHCRNPVTGSPSRFHVNARINQEIVYDQNQREHRFMTRTHNIGTGATSVHSSGRAANGSAATMVTE